jgi:GntR family transcriptional regulator/MocR family aminotransferase
MEPIDVQALLPDRASGEPLYEQLVRRFRAGIERGVLAAGTRMLPTRQLAERLGVSRNTVTSAFDQLVAEGYLVARVGDGTFVADVCRAAQAVPRRPPRPLNVSAESLTSVRGTLEAVGSSFGPLRIGATAFTEFPFGTWRRIARKHLATLGEALDYGDPAGLPALREAISRHIAQFRGVVSGPDQIVIVEGAQGALHLIAFALLRCGDTVAIEDPCYQNARAVFRAHGTKLFGVEVDGRGLRPSALPDGAALAYVTPSHQFPLGGILPVSRRMEVLEWARRCNAYVIEDDYDSEFSERVVPALQSLDRDERVIYAGTFSKTLAPGLRVGYVVVPPHLAASFRFVREIVSLGAPAHTQATVAEFIAKGYLSRHVRRLTKIYERRRRVLVDVLSRSLDERFTIGPAQTGLHVAINAPAGFDDVRAANSMSDGERVLPISLLCVEREDCKGLVLGFGSGTDESVARSAEMLARSV